MKLLALLVSLLFCWHSRGELPRDKVLHFSYSAGMTAGLYFTMSAFTGREQQNKLPCLIGAMVFTFGVGLGKELMDIDEPRYLGHDKVTHIDGGDMAANLLGIGVAAGLIYFLDIRNVQPHPNGLAFKF